LQQLQRLQIVAPVATAMPITTATTQTALPAMTTTTLQQYFASYLSSSISWFSILFPIM
jgi:hypothetical protein